MRLQSTHTNTYTLLLSFSHSLHTVSFAVFSLSLSFLLIYVKIILNLINRKFYSIKIIYIYIFNWNGMGFCASALMMNALLQCNFTNFLNVTQLMCRENRDRESRQWSTLILLCIWEHWHRFDMTMADVVPLAPRARGDMNFCLFVDISFRLYMTLLRHFDQQ